MPESCCVVSHRNPYLHWLIHVQNLWQVVSKTDLKAQDLAMLVVQLSSLIYIQGSFLLIALQFLLIDVISKAEHFQLLQPSQESEKENPGEIQIFTMRKEIKLQFLISR